MSRFSQRQKIVSWMEQKGYITSLDATNKLKIMSPSKRISELIANGYGISKERVDCRDEEGYYNHYIKYSILYYPEGATK